MNQNEDKRKEQMEQDACGIGAIVRMSNSWNIAPAKTPAARSETVWAS